MSHMPTFDQSTDRGTGGIVVRYTATGSEGVSFLVPIGSVLASSSYEVMHSTAGVANIPFLDFPKGVGDRTTTYFRVNAVAALTVGDKLVFVLFME